MPNVELFLAEMRDRDGPSFRMYKQFYAQAFPGISLADRFPIGTAETVEATSSELMRDFYERWYQPKRSALIVTGSIDVAQIEGLIRKHFISERADDVVDIDGIARLPQLTWKPQGRIFDTFHDEALGGQSVFWMAIKPAEYQADSLSARRDGWLRQLAMQVVDRRLERLIEAQEVAEGQEPLLRRVSSYQYKAYGMAQTGFHAETTDIAAASIIIDEQVRLLQNYPPGEHEWNALLEQVRADLTRAAEQAGSMPAKAIANRLVDIAKYGQVPQSPAQLLAVWQQIEPTLKREMLPEIWRAMTQTDHQVYFAAAAKADVLPDKQGWVRRG